MDNELPDLTGLEFFRGLAIAIALCVPFWLAVWWVFG